MATEQQRRVRELFEAALDQPDELRQKFVTEACGSDTQLLEKVRRLLAAKDRASGMLDTPVWQRRETNANPAEPGSYIGPYKILRELGGGAGGMGVVYQAVRADEVFQRICAIKVIRPELSAEWLLERFRQERQILARLDHVNIARIVDGGSTPDGLPYFVMDYVDGPSINHFCAEHSLGLRARLLLFQQVCKAVQYLHQNGVIHGDLKPPNILVGNDSTVKIVDFGIASAMAGSTPDGQSKTLPLMTPGYASPEQMRGQPISPPSDVYSLGVILYELLAGTLPFPAVGHSTSELLKEISTRDPIPPSIAANTGKPLPVGPAGGKQVIRHDLDCIVLKAMHRDPQSRYKSASALNADISNYLQDLPIEARNPSLLYKSTKFLLRNQRAVLAASLCVILLAATAWQEEIRLQRSEFARKKDEQTIEKLNRDIQKLQERFRDVQQAAPDSRPRLAREFENAELEDVKNLTEDYRTSLPESVRIWPSMTPARRKLLDGTGSYLHSVEHAVAPNPEPLVEAWLRLANIQGNPKTTNLGERSAAQLSISEAERLVRNYHVSGPLADQVHLASQQIAAGKK